MIYLDEQIYVTVSDFSWVGEIAAGMYQYYIFDNAAPAINLFVGNLYLSKNQYTVTVDITDIARNYCASTNKIVMLEVGIQFSAGQPSGISEPIVPIYRYPNRKSTDINWDNYNSNTVLISGKSSLDMNWVHSNSLIPTYPKNYPGDISYVFGTSYDVPSNTVLESGGYSTNLSLLQKQSLSKISLATSTKTNLKWFDYLSWYTTYNEKVEVYWNDKNTIWEWVGTDYPKYLENTLFDGNSEQIDITTFPFTKTWSGTWENGNDYIIDAYTYNYNEDNVLNYYPIAESGVKSFTGTIKYDITESFEVPEESSQVSWDGWKFSGTSWDCKAYNSWDEGKLLSIRFTDDNGDYVLEVDEPFSESYTWSWIKQQNETTITSALINFDGEYETEIPLDFINNEDFTTGDFRNVIFHLTNNNGIPNITVAYCIYTHTYTINGTTQVEAEDAELGDSIQIRQTSSNWITKPINLTPKVLYSDSEVDITTDASVGYFKVQTQIPTNSQKWMKVYVLQDGVAIGELSSEDKAVINALTIPTGTPINRLTAKGYIFNTNQEIEEVEVAVTADEDLYSYSSYFFMAGVNSGIPQIGYSSLFLKGQKTIEVGKVVCPEGYFLVWQDRYLTQQCQPFQKVDTYSEDIEGSEITNYWGKRSLYKVEVQPKWKVRTGWISDEAYRCYESLFVSPWVKLFDATNNKTFDVIINDRNFTEKTFNNQSKKLFNLEVTVEQTEKQDILY